MFAGAIAMLASAIVVAVALAHVANAYVPFDQTRLAPLVFVHYRLPLARPGFREIAWALAAWTGAFFAVLVALRRLAPGARPILAILLGQVVLLAIFLVSPLPLDSDQYAYVGYGAAVDANANPYRPAPLPHDASIARERVAAHWGNPQLRDPYGPLWTLADGYVLWPFRAMSLDVQARVLRLCAALAAVGSSLLIAATVKDPRRRATSVAAFALNPLVVLETANGAHNDIFMVACALGAAYLLRRDLLAAAGIVLGCAIATKFAYAPLVVPFAAYAWTRSRKVIGVVVSLVALAIPIALSSARFGVTNSLTRPLVTYKGNVLEHLPLLDRVDPHLTSYALLAAIVACALLGAVQILRGRIAAAGEPLMALLLFTWLFADKIEPWYALLLAPLVLLGPTGVAVFAGLSAASLVMLSGSFLNAFPTALTLIVAVLLAVGLRYAVAERSGASLTTTLRP